VVYVFFVFFFYFYFLFFYLPSFLSFPFYFLLNTFLYFFPCNWHTHFHNISSSAFISPLISLWRWLPKSILFRTRPAEREICRFGTTWQGMAHRNGSGTLMTSAPFWVPRISTQIMLLFADHVHVLLPTTRTVT
jgi:hypothetical protein